MRGGPNVDMKCAYIALVSVELSKISIATIAWTSCDECCARLLVQAHTPLLQAHHYSLQVCKPPPKSVDADTSNRYMCTALSRAGVGVGSFL